MALPPSVIVTIVDVASVPDPSKVAVTDIVVVAASSPMVSGSAVSVMAVGAVSSSAIVVVIEPVLASVGVSPPPPDGLDNASVNVSSDSASVSSVHRERLGARSRLRERQSPRLGSVVFTRCRSAVCG